MASFEQLIKSYDVRDLLDEIASAEPPAYLRRCFAEGCSAPTLSWPRIQQLAVCAMLLDAIINDRDYDFFEPELVSDWRVHYAKACLMLKDTALVALRRALVLDRTGMPEEDGAGAASSAAELEILIKRLAGT